MSYRVWQGVPHLPSRSWGCFTGSGAACLPRITETCATRNSFWQCRFHARNLVPSWPCESPHLLRGMPWSWALPQDPRCRPSVKSEVAQWHQACQNQHRFGGKSSWAACTAIMWPKVLTQLPEISHDHPQLSAGFSLSQPISRSAMPEFWINCSMTSLFLFEFKQII